MEKNKKRVVYFDILNIIAIVAVVALHCNGIVHISPNVKAWDTSLIAECIFYWAVPVFLMLSGATLMKYRERYDTKTFFKKRLLKVLIPLIFWAIIMLIWKVFIIKTIDIKEVSSLKKVINVLLQNKEQGIYYFMFDIIGIYMTMPLLSLLSKDEYRKTLWFTVLLYFIFNATLPFLTIFGIKYNSSLTVQVGNYVIYVFLGFLLSTQDLSKKQRISLYTLAVIGVIYRYLTTYFLSKSAGEVIRITWGYTSWHCILLASSIFVFVKNLNIKKIESNSKIVKLLSAISGCSFGIYLIHMMVYYYEIKCFHFNEYSWQFRTFGVIMTYVISLGIIYVLKKIPILKKIVP